MKGAGLEVIERGEIVPHPRVQELSLTEGKDEAGEHRGIARHDRSVDLTVADGALKIGEELADDALETVAQLQVDRRDLGPERVNRTTEDAAVFFLKFLLLFSMTAETREDALERRHLGGKNLIELETIFFPAMVERGKRKRGLRLEEVIEAALLHRSPFTDMLHGGAAIAPGPDQLQHGINEVFSGIADSTHGANIEEVDVRSTIFLRRPFSMSLLSPWHKQETLRRSHRR